MTLKAYRGLLYFHARGALKGGGDQVAGELLNQGWRHVCEDVMGLQAYYFDTLARGDSDYVLPPAVIKVHKVRLLDGSTCKAVLVPSAPEEILSRDATGEVSEGVPAACSVALVKFRGAVKSERCLRFDRPLSWGGDDNIEVYCTRTVETITDLDREPDLPHSLGQAGLYWACYLATLERRFITLYEEERNVYLSTGVGNEPRQMRGARGQGVRRGLRIEE